MLSMQSERLWKDIENEKNKGKVEIFMKSLAIITARGGSKRIPKKNIKEFCGKPIICYSIEAALQSGIFEEVMVSTDSEEIAEIARKCGASVPFMRSEATSNDFATTTDVINEVLANYEKMGKTFDYACCIYPTAPFITPEKLHKAYELLDEHNVNCVIPVAAFSYPPQRAYVIRNNRLEFEAPEYKNTRSQDLETQYHDAGQFYFFDIAMYKKTNQLLDGALIPMVISDLEVQDIDNESDWKIAEIKYKMLTGRIKE